MRSPLPRLRARVRSTWYVRRRSSVQGACCIWWIMFRGRGVFGMYIRRLPRCWSGWLGGVEQGNIPMSFCTMDFSCSYQSKLLREQSESECERKACDNECVLILGFLRSPISFLVSASMFRHLQPWARSNFIFVSPMSSFESLSSAGPTQGRHPFWRESARQWRVRIYTGLEVILVKRLVWIVSLKAVLGLLLD